MLLTHKKKYCDIKSTLVKSDPVFNLMTKNLTPYSIWADNEELFVSLNEAIINYAPISVNIVDFWNKNIQDTSVYQYEFKVIKDVEIIYDPFGFDEGPAPKEIFGFRDDSANPLPQANGRFDYGGFFYEDEGEDKGKVTICADEQNRFFINALIGVQDKLAFIHLNDFYQITRNASSNPALRHSLSKYVFDSKDIKYDELFGNTNVMFDEEKTSLHKEFLTKKGTKSALLYAGKNAYDAELQGRLPKFDMEIIEDERFHYTVESNMLASIFEHFIKPLAHPIGMGYNFKSICRVDLPTDVDSPLIVTKYRSVVEPPLKNYDGSYKEDGKPRGRVAVTCLCPDIPGHQCDPGREEERQPDKVFASTDGKYLWDKIKDDERGIQWGPEDKKYNILEYYEDGIGYHTPLYTEDVRDASIPIKMRYEKYIFENENYLIKWIDEGRVEDDQRKIQIEYWRHYEQDRNKPLTLHYVMKDHLHCDTSPKMYLEKKHQITEIFEVGCIEAKDSFFEFSHPMKDGGFLPSGEQKADQDGLYRGYLTTKPMPNVPGKFEGGRFTTQHPDEYDYKKDNK